MSERYRTMRKVVVKVTNGMPRFDYKERRALGITQAHTQNTEHVEQKTTTSI